MKVLKRDKSVENFQIEKVKDAVDAAFKSCNVGSKADDVIDCIKSTYNVDSDDVVSIEDIQDNIEKCLMRSYPEVAKAYIIYRYSHKLLRDSKNKLVRQIRKKLTAEDVQNQNANVDEFSFGGRMGEANRVVTKEYALENCMSRKSRKNHENNEIYIHDLDSYAVGMHNCLTYPLDESLARGVKTRQTDIRPAKSVSTAFQLVAVFFQIQSLQQFGGVSCSHIDWTMVPYVRMSFFKHFVDKYIFYRAKEEEIALDEMNYPDREKYKHDKRDEFRQKYGIDDEDYHIGDFVMKCVNFHINDDKIKKINSNWYASAVIDTKEELSQAVEGLYHNLNSLQSRSGCQLPFTSINYGTCTLPEGRMVIRTLLEGSLKGVGEHHLTPIFPCGIFQLMKGINRKEGEPNYDLYKLALKSTSLRIYPNYANVDWSVNEGYDRNNPRTYVSTMGCHAKDTKIIMADGSYKNVQDISVGDKIMGINNQIRTVQSLIRGNGKMFEVSQSRGEKYIVNEGHILALEYSISKPYKGLHKGNHINMSVHDFLKLPNYIQRRFKGYKSGYDLKEKTFDIPPYILGLWLGDGLSSGTRFSVNIKETQILKDLSLFAESIGKRIKIVRDNDENCLSVDITNSEKRNDGNKFRQALIKYNLMNNKHIPECYFHGSYSQRSDLLVGLINTDGWAKRTKGSKTICFGNTNLNLINGVKRLAESLGCTATIINARDTVIGTGICEGSILKPYYHVNIHSFNSEKLMDNKKCNPSNSKRNFNTSTLTIKEVNPDEFYGFELDGDRLYLINDCTVTHNCRTYNGSDINALPGVNPQMKDGRGNLCPVTIILPTLAMEADRDTAKFMKLLDKKIHEAKDMLLERFNIMCKQSPKAAKYMWENGTMFGYNPKEGPISALKHGTLVIGQIALAETLQLLIGTDQTTEKGMELAKTIEGLFKTRCAEFKKEYHLNFGVYMTPAENLCYTSFKKFKAKYGDIENVTYYLKPDGTRKDKKYFTNSIHVPVYKEMDPFEKIDIESQLTPYSNAGCITYVELPSSTKNNIEGLETIVNYAMDKDIPYFAVNVPIDECHDCGYTNEMNDTCPECGSHHVEHLRRVTGYLSTSYENFNLGKQDEVKDRVKHIKEF